MAPRTYLLLLLPSSLFVGCVGVFTNPEPTPDVTPAVPPEALTNETTRAEVEGELSDALGTPTHYLALGEDAEPPRDVPSADQVAASLNGGDLDALRVSLQATGMTDSEMTALVESASLHNSRQPGDPVAALADQWRTALHDAVDDFNDELEAAEQEQSVEVDRAQLRRAGVILSLDPEVLR